MVKRRATVVLGLLVLSAALAAFALAGQTRANGSASVLAVLAGRVELAHGTAAYAAATDGETIIAGDRVRTDDAGRAVVTFFDGSTLEIAPTTEITVAAASSRDGAVDLLITQAIGRTFSSVHKLVDPRSRYEVRTPSLTAAVRGTKFEIEVAADGSAAERTTEGLVAVSSAGAEVLVPAGTETRVTPGSPPAPPAPIRTTGTTPTGAATTATPAPRTVTQAPTLAPTSAPPAASAPGFEPAVQLPALLDPRPEATAPVAPTTPGPQPATSTAAATLAPALRTLAPILTSGPLPTATILPIPAVIDPVPTGTPVPLPTVTLPPDLAPTLSPSPSVAPLPTLTPVLDTTPITSPLPTLSPSPVPSIAPSGSPTTGLLPSASPNPAPLTGTSVLPLATASPTVVPSLP